MKKLLSFVLSICLIIPCMFIISGCKKEETKVEQPIIDSWDGSFAEVSQAENGVIKIESAEELAGLAKSVNKGTSYANTTIKLTADLDLLNREWTPIGFGSSGGAEEIFMDGNSVPFEGIFDGNNHTIKNLKVTEFVGGGVHNNSASGVGLFGHILNSEIKNLKIENAKIKGNHYTGAVLGFGFGSIVENCHVKDVNIVCEYVNIDESGDKAGAVVGHLQNSYYKDAKLIKCSAFDSIVSADRDAGKILGCLNYDNLGSQTTYQVNQLESDESVELIYNQTGYNYSPSTGTNIAFDEVGRYDLT